MKRFLLLIVCTLLVLPMSAQLRFGAVGGATFSSVDNVKLKNATRYHAGVTMQYRSPKGFGIQPSLVYHCKDAKIENLQTGYIELPVGLQWGPDLILFRPYLELTPMVGVAVNSRIDREMLNRLEYGVGLGGGLEIWKIQISARYNWDLSPVVKHSESAHFRYTTLSLAFLF